MSYATHISSSSTLFNFASSHRTSPSNIFKLFSISPSHSQVNLCFSEKINDNVSLTLLFFSGQAVRTWTWPSTPTSCSSGLFPFSTIDWQFLEYPRFSIEFHPLWSRMISALLGAWTPFSSFLFLQPLFLSPSSNLLHLGHHSTLDSVGVFNNGFFSTVGGITWGRNGNSKRRTGRVTSTLSPSSLTSATWS